MYGNPIDHPPNTSPGAEANLIRGMGGKETVVGFDNGTITTVGVPGYALSQNAISPLGEFSPVRSAEERSVDRAKKAREAEQALGAWLARKSVKAREAWLAQNPHRRTANSNDSRAQDNSEKCLNGGCRRDRSVVRPPVSTSPPVRPPVSKSATGSTSAHVDSTPHVVFYGSIHIGPIFMGLLSNIKDVMFMCLSNEPALNAMIARMATHPSAYARITIISHGSYSNHVLKSLKEHECTASLILIGGASRGVLTERIPVSTSGVILTHGSGDEGPDNQLISKTSYDGLVGSTPSWVYANTRDTLKYPESLIQDRAPYILDLVTALFELNSPGYDFVTALSDKFEFQYADRSVILYPWV
jgi:hypothetical protein